MIRGPVLPQVRERLWSLVATRLDRIESGLRVVMEGLDCSDGQLGLVDALARDAIGGPVLVLLATDGDALLSARVLAAGSFLHRVGDSLLRAVPEAGYCPGVSARVLVVGTETAHTALEQVARLPVVGLQVCALEPFRIGGSERFAVRWLPVPQRPADLADGNSRTPVAAALDFVTPPHAAELWARLCSICERIAEGVQIHGDRYSQRITWNGAPLGEVRTIDGCLVGSAATGVVRDLTDLRSVRRFGDQLLRAYARLVGFDAGSGHETNVASGSAAANGKSSVSGHGFPASGSTIGHSLDEFTSPVAGTVPTDVRTPAARHAANGRDASPVGESLRSSLEASRLSSEEYSALGASPSSGVAATEGAVVTEDRQQSSGARRTSPQVGRLD